MDRVSLAPTDVSTLGARVGFVMCVRVAGRRAECLGGGPQREVSAPVSAPTSPRQWRELAAAPPGDGQRRRVSLAPRHLSLSLSAVRRARRWKRC